LMEIRVTQSKRITPTGLIGQVGNGRLDHRFVFCQLATETGWRHITERPLRRRWAAIDQAAKKVAMPTLLT